jgi:hypothetical protein
MTAIYLAPWPFLQVILLLIQSFVSLCYLFACKPFDSLLQNRVEQFNEFILNMVCYPVLIFLMESEADSYDIGWLLIGLIMINIGINVLIMVIVTCLKIK